MPARQLTPEEEERKRAIYDRVSPRRRKFIERIGYDEWDPFQEPKDPIEIRRDPGSNRTTQDLIREFLQSRSQQQTSTTYNAAAFECAMGVVNNDERFRAIYDFCIWYHELLQKEGRL